MLRTAYCHSSKVSSWLRSSPGIPKGATNLYFSSSTSQSPHNCGLLFKDHEDHEEKSSCNIAELNSKHTPSREHHWLLSLSPVAFTVFSTDPSLSVSYGMLTSVAESSSVLDPMTVCIAGGLSLMSAGVTYLTGKRKLDSIKSKYDTLMQEHHSLRHERDLLQIESDSSKNLLEEFKKNDQTNTTQAFSEISRRLLAENIKSFLHLADERLGRVGSDMEGRIQHSLAQNISPLTNHLGRMQKELKQVENSRQSVQGSLSQQLTHLDKLCSDLKDKTTVLSTALKGNMKVRGKWGEITLRRVVELAGMNDFVDFDEQVSVSTANKNSELFTAAGKSSTRNRSKNSSSNIRPDLVVKLPNNRTIVLDAKAPLSALMDASEATTQEEHEKSMQAHVMTMRKHIRDLSGRRYDEKVVGSLDFVVMFLPGDHVLASAFAHQSDLYEYALARSVVLATPSTLYALLKTVAYSWKEAKQAENIPQLWSTAADMHKHTAKLSEQLGKMSSHLTKSVDAFNIGVRGYDKNLLPLGRKLQDLGTHVSEKDSQALEALSEKTINTVPQVPSRPSYLAHRNVVDK